MGVGAVGQPQGRLGPIHLAFRAGEVGFQEILQGAHLAAEKNAGEGHGHPRQAYPAFWDHAPASLDRHGFAYDEIYTARGKPSAIACLDDRGLSCRPQDQGEDAFHPVEGGKFFVGGWKTPGKEWESGEGVGSHSFLVSRSSEGERRALARHEC